MSINYGKVISYSKFVTALSLGVDAMAKIYIAVSQANDQMDVNAKMLEGMAVELNAARDRVNKPRSNQAEEVDTPTA